MKLSSAGSADRPGETSRARSVVLVGLESAGKSAVFRMLTAERLGDEANFRGSTVSCRRGRAGDDGPEIVDTPGIRLEDDNLTTRLALGALRAADTVLLVVRATHARTELERLLGVLAEQLAGRRVAVILTFRDRARRELPAFAARLSAVLEVPVVMTNARRPSSRERSEVAGATSTARLFGTPRSVPLPSLTEVHPTDSLFEHRLGALVAVLAVLVLYGGPVYASYLLSQWLQPIVDRAAIEPIKSFVSRIVNGGSLAYDVVVGNYGLLTLGWYSFLWAFPVVILLGLSVAVTDETGLKDRISGALDPWLRRIGMEGRDLAPLLTGYGCNVVAVVQSRSCSTCTRGTCMSMIAIGSACSYQIGAALSLFGAAGRPGLFGPYLVTLFVVGVAHTRLWFPRIASRLPVLAERAFLQYPSLRAVGWKVRASARQFLLQALPVFVLICAVAALLARFGAMDAVVRAVRPALACFRLPPGVAPGIVFSVLRKDGLLVLNEGDGALARGLSGGQLFTTVFLASTLTACLVTLWTVRREVGWRAALGLAGRQALTSVVSSLLIAWALAI